MSLAALIRDLRTARNLSQGGLADLLCQVSRRATKTREDISRWERGKVIPGRYWLQHIATALDVPLAVLTEQASLDRVERREFLSLSALAVVHGKLAADMIGSVAGGDPGPLTTVQTTHGTDLVIASLTDAASARRLRTWMRDGEHAVLRVNAAGILAKMPSHDQATDVTNALTGDLEARHLYMTAVLARSCALDWSTAAQLAAHPAGMPKHARFVASRLAQEVLNPRDVGARWCSALMLRDLSPLLGQGAPDADDRDPRR